MLDKSQLTKNLICMLKKPKSLTGVLQKSGLALNRTFGFLINICVKLNICASNSASSQKTKTLGTILVERKEKQNPKK